MSLMHQVTVPPTYTICENCVEFTIYTINYQYVISSIILGGYATFFHIYFYLYLFFIYFIISIGYFPPSLHYIVDNFVNARM